MEGPRAHSFLIVAVLFLFLALGFLAGFYSVNLAASINAKNGLSQPLIGANSIAVKRMQAVNAALKSGRDTYEFEVSGFHPIISKN